MKKNLLIPAFLLFTVFSCDKEDITSVQSESFVKYYTNYPEFTAADVMSSLSQENTVNKRNPGIPFIYGIFL